MKTNSINRAAYIVAALLTVFTVFSAFSWKKAHIMDDPKQEVIRLINEYRNSGNYNTSISNWPPSRCLIAAPNNLKGHVTLEVNEELMHAAQETAEKFASGKYNYDKAHHQQDEAGINGPMIRAIKDGFWPRWNEFYTAQTTPPFTGIMENLFKGPANLSPQSVVEGWKKSPGHNYTLLRASAHSMGVGMAEANGISYWVFLIESEASMDDTQENISKYLSKGKGYDFKKDVHLDPNSKAADLFDWTENIASKIKSER